MVLKRALFCGVVWCIGALQWLARPGPGRFLFLIPLLLGLAECICSVNYRKSRNALNVLLAIQGVYYLAAILYLVTAAITLPLKLLGVLVAVCMMVVILSALVTLRNEPPSGP